MWKVVPVRAGAWALVAGAMAGCADRQPTVGELRASDMKGLQDVRHSSDAAVPGDAARIDGESVSWGELGSMLGEASGAMVLREIALDRAVKRECGLRGVVIDEKAINAEEARLLDSIERDTASPRVESGVMLESIRRTRGLGDVRYRRLLERNARLRALVGPSVQVADSEVEQAMQVRYGARYRVRAIVMATEREALQLKKELEKDGAALDVAFARAAALKSTDASAARGGLLEPISPADGSYPAAIRVLLPNLEPGKVSPVISVDRGFAMFMLETRIDATKPVEGAFESAKAEIRVRKERIGMEAEAKRLLAKTQVTPLAPGLEWSWRVSPAP